MKRSVIVLLLVSLIVIATGINGFAQSQSRAQASLIREVRHELVMLPYYSVFDWLAFEARPDGAVILRGQVTRPTLRADAERAVKGIESVQMIDNQIEVLPVSPNDDRIRRAVYAALFNGDSPLLRYGMGAVPPIHIIVKNGNVALRGVVDSQTDSTFAYTRARGVSGVFNVTNELAVEGSNQ